MKHVHKINIAIEAEFGSQFQLECALEMLTYGAFVFLNPKPNEIPGAPINGMFESNQDCNDWSSLYGVPDHCDGSNVLDDQEPH